MTEASMHTPPPAGAQIIMDTGMDVDSFLATEGILSVFSTDDTGIIRTCYGDICKTVNALMDYANLLELVCEEWQLTGYHRATYELRAAKLREIAQNLQTGIGYDYAAALRKCQQQKKRKTNRLEIGEDALIHATQQRKGDGDAQ